MSKICDLTGKMALTGNHVSNSNKKIKRKFYPNLHLKKFYIPEEDTWIKIKVSTKALRTIQKLGISQVLRKIEKKHYL